MKGLVIESIDEAVELVAAGGILVVPTETVYGLASKPDPELVERIFELKQRPADKSLQLLAPGPSWMERVGRPTQAARRLAEVWWPGPLTLVVEASEGAPAACVQEATIGVRVPGHPVALELLSRTGPLAATSANVSGQPTPSTIHEIREVFASGVDGYLDGGRISGLASTVVDVRDGRLEIIREGVVSEADVRRTASTGEASGLGSQRGKGGSGPW